MILAALVRLEPPDDGPDPLPEADAQGLSSLLVAAPLKPTEVFRFAAHCEGKGCLHFDGANCRLATRIVQILPAVTEGLPACPIRPTCRWYQQEGKPACLRCPQIVTQTYEASEAYRRAAEGWDRSGPSDVRILLHADLESP